MGLRDYQQKVVDEAPDMWGLWFRMRVGKTPTSIRLASTRSKKCLTIVPASIKNQWEEEIEKWNNSDCEFIVISKDKFRRNVKDLPQVDAIIIDECFTGDTEILTSSGFVRFDKLKKGLKVAQYNISNKKISFVVPNRYIKKKYNGNLININSQKNVDIVATENHKIIVKKTKNINKILIKDVKKTNKIPVCGYSNFKYNTLSAYEKLMIVLQADGSIHHKYSNSNKSSLLFAFSKNNKINDFLKLMKDGKFEFNEIKTAKRTGKVKDLRRFIVKNIENSSKILRDNFNISEISLNKGREIIEYMVKWDGCVISENNYYYSSVVEDNVNFYQEISILSGYRARKSLQVDNRSENYKDVFRLYILKNREWQSLQCVNINKTKYNGLVYCVSVDTENIIIRRNGHIAITGNCHRAGGNYKSQFFKTLTKYIKNCNVKYIWGLTGTPLTSSSWSVYSYGKLFGKNWSWFEWRKHFFVQSPYIKIWNPRLKRKEGIWQPKPNKEEDLEKILRKIGTVIDLKDIADVPDDYDVVETFKLNTDQKKKIKGITDFLPIVKNTKTLQIENGVIKGNEYEPDQIFSCSKDKRLKELVEDNNKIAIVVTYHAQIKKYRDMFKDYNLFEIHGKTNEKADAISKKAEAAEKAVVIIQADTGVGYSLKSFNTMVFVSMSYSFVNYDQMRSRLKATDKKTPNTYVHFLTEGKSVDRGVYTSVKNKEDFNIELFSKK